MTIGDWIKSVAIILALLGGGYAFVDSRYVTAAEVEILQHDVKQLNVSFEEGRLGDLEDRIFSMERMIKEHPGDPEFRTYLNDLKSERSELKRRIKSLYDGLTP